MISYSNEGFAARLVFKCKGSQLPSALEASVPPAILTVVIMLIGEHVIDFESEDILGMDGLKSSQLWAALTSTMVFLVGFRTNKAYSRFWSGTTLLHQMYGEWFDAASCLIAFTTLARQDKPNEVADFRHALVRLMSLLHGSALEEIALAADAPAGYPAIDLGGLDQGTLKYLKACKFDHNLDFNRVEVIIHMIQTLIVHYQNNGVLKIAPPILSRVFQTLSRGQVNLANCKKITYTLFPFPYAQLIAFFKVFFMIITLFVMASICTHLVWGFCFTLIPVFGIYALDGVARELEMPFGDDANDLPLLEFQEKMNKSLLMLSHAEVDRVVHVSPNCKKDYDSMKQLISGDRPRQFIVEPREEKRRAEEDTQVPNESGKQVFAPQAVPAPATAAAAPKAAAKPAEAPAKPEVPAKPASAPDAPAASGHGIATIALDSAIRVCIALLQPPIVEVTANMRALSEQLSHNTNTLHFVHQIDSSVAESLRGPARPAPSNA